MDIMLNKDAFDALAEGQTPETLRRLKDKTWTVLENGTYIIKIDILAFAMLHVAAASYGREYNLEEGSDVDVSDLIIYLKKRHDKYMQSLN